MKKLASTIFFVVALVGSSFAQTQTPPKPGKMASVQAESKPSTGCKRVGTVRGTKLWAGNCVTAEAAAPSPGEPQSEPDKQ
jgi:hypothetical protein